MPVCPAFLPSGFRIWFTTCLPGILHLCFSNQCLNATGFALLSSSSQPGMSPYFFFLSGLLTGKSRLCLLPYTPALICVGHSGISVSFSLAHCTCVDWLCSWGQGISMSYLERGFPLHSHCLNQALVHVEIAWLLLETGLCEIILSLWG